MYALSLREAVACAKEADSSAWSLFSFFFKENGFILSGNKALFPRINGAFDR